MAKQRSLVELSVEPPERHVPRPQHVGIPGCLVGLSWKACLGASMQDVVYKRIQPHRLSNVGVGTQIPLGVEIWSRRFSLFGTIDEKVIQWC